MFNSKTNKSCKKVKKFYEIYYLEKKKPELSIFNKFTESKSIKQVRYY